MYYIIGLGNIGDKYEFTRHNTGFILVDFLREKWDMEQWQLNSSMGFFISKGEVCGKFVSLIKPYGFMNNSGNVVFKLKKQGIQADRCIVIHDEIDLPLGFVKFNYNRGPGGHRGVGSIIKAFNGKDFFRIRVGVSPVSELSNVNKPFGEEAVQRFILGNFSKKEINEINKSGFRIKGYLETFLKEGFEKAISQCKG